MIWNILTSDQCLIDFIESIGKYVDTVNKMEKA